MRQTGKAWLTILLCVVLATGCWDRREIDELTIVVAMGIDKTEEKGVYRTSFQFVNPREIAGQEGAGRTTATTVYVTTGSTLFEAIRSASRISPRRLYFGSTRVMVIGESLAREGIHEVFDLVHRNPELRTTIQPIIARGTSAESIVSTVTPLTAVPAEKMRMSLQITERVWGENLQVDSDEVVNVMVSAGSDPVISGIRLTGDSEVSGMQESIGSIQPRARLEYGGLGLFRKDRLVRWVDHHAARGVLWAMDRITATLVMVECDQKPRGAGISIIRNQTDMEAVLNGEKPEIRLSIRPTGLIGEVKCKVDLNDPKEILKLEKALSRAIKREVMAAVESAKKAKSDVFGFGDAVNRADKKRWKKWKEKWDRIFPTISVKVDVDSSIRRSGLRGEPFSPE
ncbi:Ger(x)C family spore germination protein [Desmospora profundinema]|uniref:Spore germination protein KC n=1 Tax=Desmospora profundinema TaxID=1571184 RepID=A0ABU1IKB0_9BACL|nr:Ger(x)C family spore germination protein [Desmospora profundinema]MDR6225211.1 spore germination protein KC [Desmospora profundinema]